MVRSRSKRKIDLHKKYPPSPPCSCPICLDYCIRPGWWTVAEAARAIESGLGSRMMLEIAPDLSFGVLSPAFNGCQDSVATNAHARNGCNFLLPDQRCELHGTGHQPLECRFWHHDRIGQGQQCHADLEEDWNSPAGRALAEKWYRLNRLWERVDLPFIRKNYYPAALDFDSSG